MLVFEERGKLEYLETLRYKETNRNKTKIINCGSSSEVSTCDSGGPEAGPQIKQKSGPGYSCRGRAERVLGKQENETIPVLFV